MGESGEVEAGKESRLDCTRMMNNESAGRSSTFICSSISSAPVTLSSLLINSVSLSGPGPPLLGRSKVEAPASGILLHGSSSPDEMRSNSHNHGHRLALVVSQPRSSIPSLALHVKTSVAVVPALGKMSPGMKYMLKRARYPDWETEARLRAVKPAGRDARSVDGKTAQQRFHFSIWLPLGTGGAQACAR